jgi:pyridoxine 4-dehydrogenase
MSNLKTLHSEGYFTALGLSEVNAQTLRKAHAFFPISTIEIEVSLFYLDPPTLEAIKTCEELGITCVGYSPLGRGFLSGKFKSADDITGMYKIHPRFQDGNFENNMKLVAKVQDIAGKRGCTSSQIALAYILRLSHAVSVSLILVDGECKLNGVVGPMLDPTHPWIH